MYDHALVASKVERGSTTESLNAHEEDLVPNELENTTLHIMPSSMVLTVKLPDDTPPNVSNWNPACPSMPSSMKISLALTPLVHDTPGKSLLHEGIRFQAACRLQAGMRRWHVHSKILPAKQGQGIAQVQVVLQTTGLKSVVPSLGCVICSLIFTKDQSQG